MLPVSNDTLLRMVRRRARLRAEPLRAIGIDDRAWHKGHRYGSIVCDLQRRRIVTLLADREVATVEAWLRHHPEIMVIARDRGGGYGEAASRALPNAIQVADRWHLIENASAALLDVVRKSMRLIRNAIGATTIDRELLTSAERLQHDGYLRREEANAAIMAMAKDGVPIKQIVRQTGHSRKTVRQVIRGARADVFRSRMNSPRALSPFARLALDCRLPQWRRALAPSQSRWVRRQSPCRQRMGDTPATHRRVTEGQLRKVPSARTIVWMMTMARDHLTKADSVIVAAIEAGAPMLTEAWRPVERFQTMIRKKANNDLDPWISDANPSLIASFARGRTLHRGILDLSQDA
jgi:transposase